MGKPWFRLYVEILIDTKISKLSDSEFRTFIQLLCYASQKDDGGGTNVSKNDIELVTRRKKTSKDLMKLLELSIIHFDFDNDNEIVITNWNKRQFQSDHSADRVQKFRDKKRYSNVTVTEACNNMQHPRREQSRTEQNIADESENISIVGNGNGDALSHEKFVKFPIFKFVKLTNDELKNIIDVVGEDVAKDYIGQFNDFLGKSEKNLNHYDSHYYGIRGWLRNAKLWRDI